MPLYSPIYGGFGLLLGGMPRYGHASWYYAGILGYYLLLSIYSMLSLYISAHHHQRALLHLLTASVRIPAVKKAIYLFAYSKNFSYLYIGRLW